MSTEIRYSDAIVEALRSCSEDRVEVVLPDVGDATARLVAWLMQPGDAIAAEEPLCLIAIGQGHAEIGSPAEGVVTSVGVTEGDVVGSGATLAEIALEVKGEPEPQPAAEPEPKPAPEPESEPEPEPVGLAAPHAWEIDLGSFRSPAVRHLADVLSVDLDRVEPSGRDGRITRDDVLAHAQAAGEQAADPVG